MTDRDAGLSRSVVLNAVDCDLLNELFAALLRLPTQPDTVPFSAPVLVFADSEDLPLTFSASAEDWITVHEYQLIRRNSPMPIGRPLQVAVQVDPEDVAGGAFGFQADILGLDGSKIYRTETKLRNLRPEDLRRMQGTGLPRSIDPASLDCIVTKPLDRTAVDAYLDLSGDRNPLHSDDLYAQACGLSGAVVPGMLVAGLLENALATLRPDLPLTEARVRFLAPIYLGSNLRFCLQTPKTGPDGKVSRTRIFVMDSDDTVTAIADFFM